MGELIALPNIGVKLEEQLTDVGIPSIEQLKKVGSREAWLRILAVDTSACIQRLYALEGAVRGVKDRELDQDVKASLKEFYRKHKGK
ncbi:MAG: TfoX/Sxy family protein [Bacillota bacterium]